LATLTGLERSWPLRLLCALRCPFARVRRANMWAADWSACDLVYLFQRPESMQRAADKAGREMHPAAWLASLEFEIETLRPTQVFTCLDGRPLWLYRLPFEAATALAATPARALPSR
ncbi:MAG: class I SAM-dependent methyltransferase, partial [Pseudomonadota bacterium]|nr:class I SAM-dependent methyltransferase [Pseudomonadota bacterium]